LLTRATILARKRRYRFELDTDDRDAIELDFFRQFQRLVHAARDLTSTFSPSRTNWLSCRAQKAKIREAAKPQK
jgi:macrodomain Ter protein organizer (MatP/YcbG family)